MPQTTRLACTEKQSWVGLSHFWKTYTLYLFAICDTDLQSGCHIFGRLTGAEIWLGDQAEAKCRCGRKIKTQSDIFLQVTQTKQASTVSYQETKWNIPRITEAILPSHTLLFGHCDFHAYNTEQSERNDQWIFGDVWWELYPTEPPTEGKLRWMYGVGGSWKGWWELGAGMEVAFTPNRTHIDWPGGPIYIKCVLGNTIFTEKLSFVGIHLTD